MARQQGQRSRAAQHTRAGRAPGRPREFNADRALDRAMHVFWRRGYEGASLPELTRAMGISRPSLYAAFGDKQSLFRRAVERYTQGPASYFHAALDAPTARESAERLLRGAVDLLTCPTHPRGCLLVQGMLAGGRECDGARRLLLDRRARGLTAIRRRFERARAEGDLPRDSSPADLARFLATVVHGLSVQAASGASRRELRRVAGLAMRAWPGEAVEQGALARGDAN